MTITPNLTLYVALAFYTVGTLHALASLFRPAGVQKTGLVAMVAGFVSHTIWIGTICVITGHPPLTNLAETSSFVAWTLLAVEVALFIRYRVYAASFFVYPLVLLLLTLTAVVREPFAPVTAEMRSTVFTAHLLLSTVGVAALLVGLAFTALSYLQDRALKAKTRGPLWDRIPSLSVCRLVSHRALAAGFSIYTAGLLAGVLWSYRVNAGPIEPRVKQIAALVAWVLFALLLQSSMTGVLRGKGTVIVSAGALLAVVVSILGIAHG